MPALRIALLALAVVGVLVRPRGTPPWLVPVVAVAVSLAVGATDARDALDSLDPLVEPLVFLLAAVPLALLLDELGFFRAVASRVDHSRHLHLWLWLFAAGVTTVLNLDASVVLLTPLYVRIARRHGLDPIAAAFSPVLLASLASSALPVSNLTNLLAAERYDLHAGDFLLHLGPATLAATAVGFLAYRRTFHLGPVPGDGRSAFDDAVPEHALRRGLPIVAFVLVGFTIGDVLGIPVWSVAVAADVVLVAMIRAMPWRSLPVGAAALAAALGVLAAGAAPHLRLDELLGEGGDLRVLAISALGANAINNLPALLVGMPALGADPGGRLWALLLGVNIGPVLVVSGSLAGLLWHDTVHRLGVDIDARRYSAVGLRVGLPALVAATAVLLVTNAVVG